MMTIEISETILGPFARPEDARRFVAILAEEGWPAVYREPAAGDVHWTFDTLADYRRFMQSFEAALDKSWPAGEMVVSWACDCEDMALVAHRCPHGDDPYRLPLPEGVE